MLLPDRAVFHLDCKGVRIISGTRPLSIYAQRISRCESRNFALPSRPVGSPGTELRFRANSSEQPYQIRTVVDRVERRFNLHGTFASLGCFHLVNSQQNRKASDTRADAFWQVDLSGRSRVEFGERIDFRLKRIAGVSDGRFSMSAWIEPFYIPLTVSSF